MWLKNLLMNILNAQRKNKQDNKLSGFDLIEIINGEEVERPTPFCKHQRICGNILFIINNYLSIKHTKDLCLSFVDVILEDGINVLQPDIFFIRKDNMTIAQDWIRGVPDMVCEIVSKGTYRKDTETKRVIYERYQVPEYWIVIPELEIMEILTIENGKYTVFAYADTQGIVKSKIIEGLQFDIKDVFEE